MQTVSHQIIKLDRPHTLYALYKGWENVSDDRNKKYYDPTENVYWIYESAENLFRCIHA